MTDLPILYCITFILFVGVVLITHITHARNMHKSIHDKVALT